MKLTKMFLVASLGALLVVSFGAFRAQDELEQVADPAVTTTVSGTLVSRSGDELVVEKDSGATLTFTLDESAVMPEQIQPGHRVVVAFDSLDGRTYHAVSVEQEVAAAQEPSAPPEPSAPTPEQPADDQSGATATTPQEETMPRTASPLPLIALIGVLTTGAAAGLRAFRRRSV